MLCNGMCGYYGVGLENVELSNLYVHYSGWIPGSNPKGPSGALSIIHRWVVECGVESFLGGHIGLKGGSLVK